MQSEISAEAEFNVEFYDVDSMKIVWHGNYIKFFEKARCALLDKIGYDYLDMEKSGWLFPVASISVKFINSFTFKDTVRAKAILTEYENCIRIKYELYNSRTGKLCTKGESTQMAVNAATLESSMVCPAVFINKVEALLEKINASSTQIKPDVSGRKG